MATQQLADGSVDPNVVIPKHIRDQAAAAEAIHKQAYVEATLQPELPQAAAQVQTPQPDPPPQVEPAPQQAADPPQQPQPEPLSADDNTDSWKHKFLSMQGRWQASQKQLGQQIEINSQLAGELQATQQLVEQNRPVARTTPAMQPGHSDNSHEKLITQQDVDTYGAELIDTVQRAAREVVAPELDALRNENAELKKRVITTGQRDVQAELARSVPNWVAVNRSPEFAQWLSLRNIYTGQVRRQMLNAAYQAADAPQVVQLFKDFLTEVRATGGTAPASQRQQQQPQPQDAAPRQPAMALESLAAPGRARPAPGDAQVPAEKPLYTRALISKNYADRRRGLWNGREADWASLEADMIAAGNEGRVRN